MAKEYVRRAHHAGSWYEDDPDELKTSLDAFLFEASQSSTSGEGTQSIPRGIIAPHAGYSYSGPTAGFAYSGLKEALNSGWRGTILVLHPSHHVYLDGCAVSGASSIETPVGNIPVDTSLRLEILGTGKFSTMTQRTDENEHSGEMQYPFIALLANNISSCSNQDNDQIHILPIMVGATSTSQSKLFGVALAPFISRPNIFTVISTDFCHWGYRFDYSPTSAPDSGISFNAIHEFIEWLDRQGMEQISLQDPGAFAKYMKKYKNTICGRYPISVYLNALQSRREGDEGVKIEFVKYAQSSAVKRMNESSVSYASAIVRKI